MTTRALIARARGALLGLAVGDAMGSTTEFQAWHGPDYPQLASVVRRPVGGGAFRLVPGQTTDDTQLAIALARVLFEHRGWTSIDVADSYIDWHKRGPFDIGGQTSRALGALRAAQAVDDAWVPLDSARAAGSPQSAGNGAMMRAGAIAAWGLADGTYYGRLLDVAAWDCELTHAHPSAILANVAFVAACFSAAMSPRDRGRSLADRAMRAVQEWQLTRGRGLLSRYPKLAVRDAALELGGTFRSARAKHNPRAGAGGWCHTSLGIALWHLARDTSYRHAIMDVASRGGDADTNAAITGALLGARFGDNAIPYPWLRTILQHRPVNHAAHYATVYHPMRLVELLEKFGPLPARLMKAAYGPA